MLLAEKFPKCGKPTENTFHKSWNGFSRLGNQRDGIDPNQHSPVLTSFLYRLTDDLRTLNNPHKPSHYVSSHCHFHSQYGHYSYSQQIQFNANLTLCPAFETSNPPPPDLLSSIFTLKPYSEKVSQQITFDGGIIQLEKMKLK